MRRGVSEGPVASHCQLDPRRREKNDNLQWSRPIIIRDTAYAGFPVTSLRTIIIITRILPPQPQPDPLTIITTPARRAPRRPAASKVRSHPAERWLCSQASIHSSTPSIKHSICVHSATSFVRIHLQGILSGRFTSLWT
ncbi:hypothetical protein E2C01_033245 [Portunus trituberculatus]|uniref:Uncharacterized protein n=1 Tax=Portunus trituberculatus TaxID=210409 RepID=A0A5B7EXD2_PORTR|nr:hypothetical protein [Portunus trituberculatus]